ncbi:acyl-CoA dehydrogenase [Cupriavidus pauculus]|uniref:acyl-CoA dehydrogenase n=1 Tax=Cupriavidus pauculus TaxID=82633 RepID=UPI0012489BF1|nr:acyl-CoA dehydrogenase [Cupriavidus pauculus]KAB0605302.1 acyl-CoA dehydrogenase [Cupriavidus pauculus]MCM3605212.1 acyl-CoA dehydrogenase [Cupriavidus pauculus]UAK99665.1 acyl-CoA dehydrogenase [Cupriavidus pauculus]
MDVRETLAALIGAHMGREDVPLPGRGSTAQRWSLFARIAAEHGAVAIKLFEAHADALAILAELADATPPRDTRWAVWAAEPPDARVRASACADTAAARAAAHELAAAIGVTDVRPVVLDGRKAWCSGARGVSHALITCEDRDHGAWLAAIDLNGAGVTITDEGWHAVGMADTGSGDVLLDNCPALLIGPPRGYVERPGFWHGGAGIAACWYGAVLPMAHAVRQAVQRRGDAHAAAHLGAIHGDLHAAAALLRETAAWIDAHPDADAFVPAMRARTTVEAVVQRVLHRAGSVLGAGPLCRDARLAALFADLPVFLRQSHAERDLAALGMALREIDTDITL